MEQIAKVWGAKSRMVEDPMDEEGWTSVKPVPNCGRDSC